MIASTLKAAPLLLPLAAAFAQDPSPSGSLPPEVAVVLNGEAIPLSSYKDYLFEVHGRRWIDAFVASLLLEREAARLGVAVEERELEESLASHMEELAASTGGPDELDAMLASKGHDRLSYAHARRADLRREMLASKICAAARTIDEKALRQRYEERYGASGSLSHVQHIWLTRARTRMELESSGAPPQELTAQNIERVLLEKAKRLALELEQGADFEQLARAQSHAVQASKNGGMTTSAEIARIDPELERLVRTAPIGPLQGPAATEKGVHLFQVLTRVEVTFDEVRNELEAELRAQPATHAELMELDRRMRENTQVIK
jgi:hypothetical protein